MKYAIFLPVFDVIFVNVYVFLDMLFIYSLVYRLVNSVTIAIIIII